MMGGGVADTSSSLGLVQGAWMTASSASRSKRMSSQGGGRSKARNAGLGKYSVGFGLSGMKSVRIVEDPEAARGKLSRSNSIRSGGLGSLMESSGDADTLGRRSVGGVSSGSGGKNPEHRFLVSELKHQNYDAIRFASYRTASKLRFIQKKTTLHLVDIWNVIEAFRENGLNTLDPQTEVGVSRLETLLISIYNQLNKRQPVGQQVDIDAATQILLSWLLAAYDTEGVGRIRVFAVKVALATMCSGKLMDKLRYIFSQISDCNGHMIASRFNEYLREALCLPAAVFESPSFPFSDSAIDHIFEGNGRFLEDKSLLELHRNGTNRTRVNVNHFLDCMMTDPGPQCLVWLPLLHRVSSAENVVHPVQCSSCSREGFTGFRYKCTRCSNYNMCQDCFWRGNTTHPHTLDHEVKEYTAFKSPSKQLSHSLRKSFRCVPEKRSRSLPRFPEQPERTLNLSHIVPPSPLPAHNGFDARRSFDLASVCSFVNPSPSRTATLEAARVDDEHRLIQRYAARLASDANHSPTSTLSEEQNMINLDSCRAQRELIAQLENKNREIIREISRLRREQEIVREGSAGSSPELLQELTQLRRRKGELEDHLQGLQDTRRELMRQLESLMNMLKNSQASHTPTSSPGSGGSLSRSAPTTPGADPWSASHRRSASSSSAKLLCNDLLTAADSVTNAMSSLVSQLNSEGSEDEEEAHIMKPLAVDMDLEEDSLVDGSWQETDRRLPNKSFPYLHQQDANPVLTREQYLLRLKGQNAGFSEDDGTQAAEEAEYVKRLINR